MGIVLIGGGSRSGKTRQALDKARARGSRLGFIATAQALDGEMRERIAAHQRERGVEFETIEEPVELADAVRRNGARFEAIVVDCLTLWLSNMMLASGAERPLPYGRGSMVDELIEASAASPAQIILVTNEVGCGIVPETELGRRFRDEAGRLNQRIADAAEEVYWMIFGCALRVK